MVELGGPGSSLPDPGPLGGVAPAPGVPEPNLGEDMKWGVVRPAVVRRDSTQDDLVILLGVLNKDVKVSPRSELVPKSVNQFILLLRLSPKRWRARRESGVRMKVNSRRVNSRGGGEVVS